MKIRLFALLAALLFAGAAPAIDAPATTKLNTTADHSKFKELQQEFDSGPEVTKACLTCHTEAASAGPPDQALDLGIRQPGEQAALGKKNVINNFCISVLRSN